MRESLKKIPLLYQVLRLVAGSYRKAKAWPAERQTRRFRAYCSSISSLVPKAVFVKVGANDGLTGDPCSDILVRDKAWTGLLIEPVPYCFRRLKENFQDPARFRLEQVAIGRDPGVAKFYFVHESAKEDYPELPGFYDQIGSFDKQHLMKHLDQRVHGRIVEMTVPVWPLDAVLRRNGITGIHLLHIDVEGYDYEVLKTVAWQDGPPVMIFLEHKHLSRADKIETRKLLRSKGYSVRDCGSDYFALNDAAHKRLARGFSPQLPMEGGGR